MKRELEYQQQKYIFLLPLLWLIGMYSLCNKGVYKSFNILFWAILAQFDLFQEYLLTNKVSSKESSKDCDFPIQSLDVETDVVLASCGEMLKVMANRLHGIDRAQPMNMYNANNEQLSCIFTLKVLSFKTVVGTVQYFSMVVLVINKQ